MKTLDRTKRKFPGRVTAMLHGIASITDAAIEHASGLSEEDTSISAASLGILRRRIDDLRVAVLAADKAARRREEQAAVRKSSRTAAEELASLKTFIETRFFDDAERRNELLHKLGFSDFYIKAVYRGQHGDMGALLTKVAGNLDADLEASLILAGLPAKRVDVIRELARDFHDHTTGHEGGLGHQRELTDADIAALNAMYVEVMAIAKKAKRHFSGQTAIRERFVLSKVSVYGSTGKKLPDTNGEKQSV